MNLIQPSYTRDFAVKIEDGARESFYQKLMRLDDVFIELSRNSRERRRLSASAPVAHNLERQGDSQRHVRKVCRPHHVHDLIR